MYDEAVKLKQSMNVFQQENIRLKTKVVQCDKELERKDKIINDLLGQIASVGTGNSPSVRQPQNTTHLVLALKKQLRENKDEIRIKEEEIKKLKKSLKITRLQETEVEIKMFSDECTRLKHIIEEIMKQKAAGYTPEDVAVIEQKIAEQDALIRGVKQQNAEMAELVRKKDEEISNWRDVTNKLKSRLTKMENETKENVKNRKLMTETKKEMQKLKEQLNTLKGSNKDNKEIVGYKARIEELLRKQTELNEKLDAKEKKIKSLESRLSEDSQSKEKEREQELAKLRQKMKESEAELSELKKSSGTDSAVSITKNDLKAILTEVRVALAAEKIVPEKIFTEFMMDPTETITIHELARIFKRKPLKCKQDSTKLAQYLVENNKNSRAKYNEKSEAKLESVIDKLKILLGEPLSEEAITKQLAEVSFF